MSLGVTLVEANDFAKWLFTIEVMGDSVYQVRLCRRLLSPSSIVGYMQF
jgi:hypothetical protein